MIRFEALEIAVDHETKPEYSTYLFGIGLIEIDYGAEPALFQFGWLQGDWYFDLLYFSWFKTKYEIWKERDL